ncbi:MAG: apolipoprotein N-acyltransferase [Acidobacteria bacterium]|nr:apolipoprotein N-acyltransferase [Acidobacteriota bacterium]
MTVAPSRTGRARGRGWKRGLPWLVAAASAVFLALALPGPGLWPLVLLFPACFLEAVHRTSGWKEAAGIGLFAGTVHWAIATHWVVPVMHHYGGLPLAAAVLCLVAMAAFLGITWSVCAAATRLAGPRFRPWVFAFAWAAVEASRQTLVYRFPWNPTAAALAFQPHLLGSISVWGATGLGWALAAVGAAAWAVLRPPLRHSGIGLGVCAAVCTAAFTIAAPAARPAGPTVAVAALQPGTTLEETWDPADSARIADRVWQLTHEAAAAGAQVVLWPESAVPYILERDTSYRDLVTTLARQLKINIVLNSIGFTSDGGYTNAAYVVTPAGVEKRRYDKIRLVPFGEYVPFVGRLAFARALVRQVGHFTPGHDKRPLAAGPLRVGMAICYEIVFPDLVAAEVRRGAQVLTTLTNDGWYGYSWAPTQHFAQAVLRAVETRRWVVRAALTGISGFIDPQGRVVDQLPVGAAGLLVHRIRPMRGLTPRARFGDWWAVVCLLGLIGAAAWSRRG